MIFIYKNNTFISGSVSVFFAIIMVVLITFLFTIFDFSRLQFIQLEASSNFDASAELALSQYEPLLLHQYGIFAGHQGNQVEAVFKESLETQFYPDNAPKHTYLMDYFLSDTSKSPKLYLMEPTAYEFELTYEAFINHDYNYPKEQILEYMKLREPYLLLKPFLSNLDILSKTSRSSSIIEEKNDLLTSFDSMEKYKRKLYELVDGIVINDNGNWYRLEDDYYVRKFTYNNAMRYPYFPVTSVSGFKNNVFDYSSSIAKLEDTIQAIESELEILLSKDAFTFVYEEVEDSGELRLIEILEKETTKVSIIKLKNLNNELALIDELEMVLEEILNVNNKALSVVMEYESICSTNIEEINSFQSRLKNKDSLIESVSTQINEELDLIKSEMSVSEINFSDVNNLPLIKDQLEANITNIGNALIYISSLNNTLEDYIYRRYLAKRDTSSMVSEQLDLLNAKLKEFVINHNNYAKPVELSTVNNLISFGNSFASCYEEDVFFDYSLLNIEKKEENVYEDKEKSLLGFDLLSVFRAKDLIKFFPELAINENLLPSHKVLPYTLSMNDFSMLEHGIDDEDLEVKVNLLDIENLKSMISELHDTVLINEYAIGMFSNVRKANNPNSKSLNGFKVDEHFLKYETEYVIGGFIDEQKNMDLVLRYLYGTRLTLNLLHLAMDNSKRTTIMSIANTIAGWWTGGIGAIIIAIVIAAVWALLESIADVFMLLTGERVPLIKTRSSWYTSLDGNIMDLFNQGVKELENEFIIYMEETKDTVKKAFSGIRELVEKNKSLSSDEDYLLIQRYLDELSNNIVDLGEELGLGLDMFEIEFDAKLEAYINNGMKDLLSGSEDRDKNEPAIYFEDESSQQLADDIMSRINYEFNMLQLEEQSLSEAVDIKVLVFEEFKNRINSYKEGYKDRILSLYNEAMKVQLKILEEGVSELMKNGSKIGRELIVSKADDIKAEFLDEAKVGVSKESSLEFLIPCFSYEDYLRLYMLLPIVDEQTKIARIMDLIQMNTQKAYSDFDILLDNYYVGVHVEGSVETKSLFIPNIDKEGLHKEWELDIINVSKYY